MQRRLSSIWQRCREIGQQVAQQKHIQNLLARVTEATDTISTYGRIHRSLITLTLFIVLNNAIVVRAANSVPDLPIDNLVSDPYEIADTVRLISDYTPNINEDPDAIALALEERTEGSFISTNPLIATMPSAVDEPTSTESPATQAAERDADTKYTVQIGDTLSGIGSKFGLRIATLQIKNKLTDADSIKPGQELVIPAENLSDKAIKAAEERQVASKTAATKKKQTVLTSAGGGYGLVVPIRHNGITRGLIGGHTGIDYRANTGTPVVAAAEGVVAIADRSGWNGGYGVTVLINHGGGKTTRYAHLSAIHVNPGERVGRGEVIGLSGNTGRSTGPHLHFELRMNGTARNPF